MTEIEEVQKVAESHGEKTALEMVAFLRQIQEDYSLEALAWYYQNGIAYHGVGDFLEAFRNDEGIEDLRAEVHGMAAKIETLPGRQLLAELRAGLNTRLDPIEWQDADDVHMEDSPHFPSSCAPIDEILDGKGLYGVTTIAGAPKVGKSLMALSCAIESARAGWRVIYCNAEMSRAHFGQRLRNYMGRVDPIVAEQLKIAHVTTGISQSFLLDALVDERVEAVDDRLLIVLDSINRIVDMGTTEESEAGYWRLLRDWSAWAMNTRRSTEGAVSWVIVSELAQHGGVKGRSLEYLSDVVVRINATGTDDIVEVDIPYSRATRGGYIGALRRDFKTGRFLRGN